MAPKEVWISDRRLYLTADGQVVGASDPRKHRLLVPAGGALPLVEAQRLGLVADAAPPAPQGKPAPKNKAKTAPEGK